MEDDLKNQVNNPLWIGQYILNEQDEPVPEKDTLKWAAWLESHERHVAFTNLGFRGIVSTVFLGLDHNFIFESDFKPVLWETMVFGGPFDQKQRRYNLRQEALAGHAEIVRECRHDASLARVLFWWLCEIGKNLCFEFRRKQHWLKEKWLLLVRKNAPKKS
jgi:hypothetical protein